MANDFSKNPITMDTLGLILEDKAISIESVQWVNPTTALHGATLEDQNGSVIFQATCVTAKQNLIKYFFKDHTWVGLRLKGLSSGRLDILIKEESFYAIHK